MSKSQVGRLCAEIDERVNAFLSRPLEGAWPYLWLDASYLKVREGGRIVGRAVIIAVAVNEDGEREVPGVATGPSEAETFWTEFLRSLADRGLRGVKLVIADDHKGLRAAARRVFNATHQRCRIHRMRNALAHAPARQRTAVAAMLKTIFARETKADAEARREIRWEIVADALREAQPKLGTLMDASRDDVPACIGLRPFLPQTVHRTVCRLRRTGANSHASIGPRSRARTRLSGSTARRSGAPTSSAFGHSLEPMAVMPSLPNDEAIVRLVGAFAIVLEPMAHQWLAAGDR